MNASKNYWILNEKHEAVPADAATWGYFRQKHFRIAKTLILGADVSTVFLGINHRFGPGKPLLFETMVFGGPLDELCWRYETWQQAGRGHKRAVRLVILLEFVPTCWLRSWLSRRLK
jgi:hypothetical protein